MGNFLLLTQITVYVRDLDDLKLDRRAAAIDHQDNHGSSFSDGMAGLVLN